MWITPGLVVRAPAALNINGNGINYASYLGQYFRDNNQRVNRNSAPELSQISVSQGSNQISVSGIATDADADSISISASFTNSINQIVNAGTVPDTTGNFSLTSPVLANDWYQVTVTATDSEGLASNPYSTSVLLGPPPPATAPELSELAVVVDGQCATVTGRVFDLNRDLASVSVEFSTGTVAATLNGDLFSAQRCGLAGGNNTALVTALDAEGLFSSELLNFSIDAGQNATLDQHIAAGRLNYTNYANCYLEYSTASFILREQLVTGNQCRWQDNDASCFGPTQSCSSTGGGDDGGDPTPPPPADCVQFSTNNYSHKLAGRAYSTGNIYTPNYFATGSNTALAGSTWGVSVLSSTSSGYWQLGACPQ